MATSAMCRADWEALSADERSSWLVKVDAVCQVMQESKRSDRLAETNKRLWAQCPMCHDMVFGDTELKYMLTIRRIGEYPGIAYMTDFEYEVLKFAHEEKHRLKKKHHIGNGKPSGAFAFTLTKSPKDPFTVGDMLKAVRKIMSQKSCPVKRYAWYYEDKGRDEKGDPIHPHIHGMYETESGGRIEQKHFKRAWPIWSEEPDDKMGAGFRGGYHRPVKDTEAYSDYIKKDGGMSESKD